MNRDELHWICAGWEVHAHALEIRDGGRWQPRWKLHRPRQMRGNAVVITDQETPDASERVPQRERSRADLHRESRRDFAAPAVQQNRRHRAEKAAVPDESSAPKQRFGLAREKH